MIFYWPFFVVEIELMFKKHSMEPRGWAGDQGSSPSAPVWAQSTCAGRVGL